jgi:hypothetical protein
VWGFERSERLLSIPNPSLLALADNRGEKPEFTLQSRQPRIEIEEKNYWYSFFASLHIVL